MGDTSVLHCWCFRFALDRMSATVPVHSCLIFYDAICAALLSLLLGPQAHVCPCQDELIFLKLYDALRAALLPLFQGPEEETGHRAGELGFQSTFELRRQIGKQFPIKTSPQLQSPVVHDMCCCMRQVEDENTSMPVMCVETPWNRK